MKVLFIGGTGVISSACAELAIDHGIDLYLLNRGITARPVPAGAQVLTGDIRDLASARAALGDQSFDAVVDWIGFVPENIETDLELFRGRMGQFVFISSASVYQSPPERLPVTEATPLDNPYWQYSRDKIACEERLMRAYRDEAFPVTIVRPSHTYDQTKLPLKGGYTAIDRMRRGKKVIVHGDGSSLWVLTNHRDFATGFVGLLGNPAAEGIREVMAWYDGDPSRQVVDTELDQLMDRIVVEGNR
ncbi:MAG: NAD-dependent epimerase/dehydratase family protein [Pyrinomonadaceae bacterium]